MTRGSRVDYTYDVRRLTRIAQKLVLERSEGNVSGETLLQMDYTYTADDLPWIITESGTTLNFQTKVTYTYDNRRRLTHEVRERFDGGGVSAGKDFDLAYTYDAGGEHVP